MQHTNMHTIEWRTASTEEILNLLQSDQAMYPTKRPVTAQNVHDWYKYYPELAMICIISGKPAGYVLLVCYS
jgi:hypothetical protein